MFIFLLSLTTDRTLFTIYVVILFESKLSVNELFVLEISPSFAIFFVLEVTYLVALSMFSLLNLKVCDFTVIFY
jgi:hypothetical protein